MALVRLRECAGSHEHSQVAYVISTIVSWAGSFDGYTLIYQKYVLNATSTSFKFSGLQHVNNKRVSLKIQQQDASTTEIAMSLKSKPMYFCSGKKHKN